MPNFTQGEKYSEALREAYASAPTEVLIFHTIEIRHPAFIDDAGQPTAVRVVRDTKDLTATLEALAPMNPSTAVLFKALYFDFTLPSEVEGGTPEIEIQLLNVGRDIMEHLDAAIETATPIEVTYRPYLSTDLTNPHMDPVITLTLRSVSATLLRVIARAGYGDTPNKRFPKIDYTAAEFPGLAAK